MLHRLILPLAYVSALTGCVSAPPEGAFVEYREGLTPITRPSPCKASYALRPAAEPEAQPLALVRIGEGVRVGFRRERDGSVTAIGPKVMLPLEAGAYVWEVVPGSVPPWKTRAKQGLRKVAKAAGVLTLLGLEAMIPGDDDPAEPTTAPTPPYVIDYYPNNKEHGP